MDYPKCPHLQGNTCLWLSERIRPGYRVTPRLCNGFCQSNGPFAGRDIPAEQEKTFVDTLAKLKKSSPTIPIEIKPQSIWSKVAKFWTDAEGFANAARSRGAGATLAHLTGISDTLGARVSEDVYQTRKASCEGCDLLRSVDGKKYCGACGCGKNKLAIISDEENPQAYTKLYYPDLRCPIGKAGFSNAVSDAELSIVMPSLNDNEEANLTVKSIRETSPAHVEIIAVDDASEPPLTISDPTVKIIRNVQRVGPGKSRHIGAEAATKKHLLFIDSHMRFEPGWFEKAMSNVVPSPKTLWSAACLGLDAANMDVMKPNGVYTGARLVLLERNRDGKANVFDAIWQEDKPGDNYEIGSVMGACYFIHRDWFFYLGGLESNRMYGSEEPALSVKTWLAGGEVRLMKSVRVGHKFRDFSPYRTQVADVIYNRIRPMKTMFPENVYSYLTAQMGNDPDTQLALERLAADSESVEKERSLYNRIFVHDINWLCLKFGLPQPWL